MSANSADKGAWIGSICLVILVFQNTLFFYATHEGRVPDEDGHLYYAPTMVVLIELIKALISFGILFCMQFEISGRSANRDEYSLLATSTKQENLEEGDVSDDEGSPVQPPHSGRIRFTFSSIADLLFVRTAWKLCIPATLYVIQTNLAVIGAQNLGESRSM